MHWPSHCKAFYAQWLIRYMHPRKSPWKSILKFWIQSEHLSEGPLLSTCSINMDAIPRNAKYMRACLKAFKSIRIKQHAGATDRTCLAEPIFYNNRFKIDMPSTSVTQWARHLSTTHIRDLIDASGQEHNDNQWSLYFHTHPSPPTYTRPPPSLRMGSTTHGAARTDQSCHTNGDDAGRNRTHNTRDQVRRSDELTRNRNLRNRNLRRSREDHCGGHIEITETRHPRPPSPHRLVLHTRARSAPRGRRGLGRHTPNRPPSLHTDASTHLTLPTTHYQ